MNTQFQPVSLFFGLFANKWPAELNPQEFSQLLHQALPEFDQPPALAQLPPNAPGDVPRIMLFNKPKTKVLEIAPVKIQLRCQRPPERPSLAQWLPEFSKLLGQIAARLTEHGWSFVRTGLVATLFREVGASVNQLLCERFFKEHSLFQPSPHEVQINVLAKLPLGDDKLMVNRWLKIKPLRRSPGNEDFALEVQVDINTLPENASTRSLQDLHDFVQLAGQHLEQEIAFLLDETFSS